MPESVLTLVGEAAPIAAAAAASSDALCALGATASEPDWLAPDQACDLFFDLAEPHRAAAAVRRSLAERLPGARLDVFVQRTEARRKRLIVADLESTLIENEMLDELVDCRTGFDHKHHLARQGQAFHQFFQAAATTEVFALGSAADEIIDLAHGAVENCNGITAALNVEGEVLAHHRQAD